MKVFNHVGKPILAELKQITSESGSRVYLTPQGTRYPSITTILQNYKKKELMEWRRRVGEAEANRISSSASRRGTKLHSLVEQYLDNKPLPAMNPLQQELFSSIKPLLDDIDNIHIQEQRLYSDHLRLAGTVDCIAEHQGRLSIIDFKSSTRPKDKKNIENYFMQCAAYAIMYEELTKIPVDKIVLIVAVEGDDPQLFVEKRNNYVSNLLYYRDLYENTNGG
jgi:genome maintenance exonuclease 1